MTQSTVFKNNKSQAVRLPKPVALPESVKKVDRQIRKGKAYYSGR
jgi:antitoxin VapB